MTGERKNPYNVSKTGAKPGELKFSMEKTIDSINNYTRFKAMALAPISATGNFIMGSVNNFIQSAGKLYYTDNNLASAYYIMKGSIAKYYSRDYINSKEATKVAELLTRYNVIGDTLEKQYHGGDFLNWFYTLQSSGEFLNQGASAIAQTLHEMVDMADGSKQTLWSLYDIDKQGKIFLQVDKLPEDSKWRDPAHVNLFFAKVRKVNQKIHGDYTSALMAKRDVAGRVAMLFRTWLPMAIKEHFGSTYHDDLLGEQKGRFVSLKNVVVGSVKDALKDKDASKLKPLIQVVGKLLAPVLGRQIKMTGTEIDIANINMAIRELHFIMMLSLSCIALKGAIDDEDEDAENVNVLRYLYNQGERAQSELMFFFAPTDMMQIIRDVAPIYSTIKEANRFVMRTKDLILDPEEDTYKRGFRKGQSKAGVAAQQLFPVTRSIQKTWSATEQIFSDARYE